jgi:hypothetical protein
MNLFLAMLIAIGGVSTRRSCAVRSPDDPPGEATVYWTDQTLERVASGRNPAANRTPASFIQACWDGSGRATLLHQIRCDRKPPFWPTSLILECWPPSATYTLLSRSFGICLGFLLETKFESAFHEQARPVFSARLSAAYILNNPKNNSLTQVVLPLSP